MARLDEARRSDLRSAGRFLLVGGANTLVTWALFAVLARMLDPRVAYTVVFVAGLVFTTFATGRYVFAGGRTGTRSSLLFVGWYLLIYGVGLVLVSVLDTRTDLGAELLALVVVAVTAPLNFIGGRLIFAPRADTGDRV